MSEKEVIDYYFDQIKSNKDDAISCFKKLKKRKINPLSLGLKYFFKYIYINIKECFRNLLHNFKLLIKYIKLSIAFKKIKIKRYNIISDKETVDKVVNEGYSIARFGDGEFKWILGIKQNSFQKNSKELSERLLKIIKDYNNDSKLLLGINDTMNNLNEYNFLAKLYWKEYLINLSKKIYEIVPNCTYCSTNITRPYIDFKNKDKKLMRAKFDNLKRIWDKRDVILVEGEFTKLGVGNDLFDNCKSISRIICPATDAFSKYKEIVKAIRKQSKENLFLISLGPTATILAYDMSKEGYQCIDTGHIDIEYMWFLDGARTKEEVEGKYVNEVSKKVINKIDNKYEKQIIEKIK